MKGHAYSEFPPSDVGFPKGDSPEEFLANMMTYLKEAAAKLENPAPPPVLSPAAMRDLAAIQEAVLVEKEVRKGDAGHPIATARADLLRNDIWDRWRAGAGLPPLHDPLTDAIGKLADVADRQLALLQQAATVQQPVTIHRPDGNITGTAAYTPELVGKNIEFIRELLPKSKKLGLFAIVMMHLPMSFWNKSVWRRIRKALNCDHIYGSQKLGRSFPTSPQRCG